jgi:hypothetical protein
MIRSAPPTATASFPAPVTDAVPRTASTALPALDTVSNAPSPRPGTSPLSSTALMECIAAGDAYLCQWMAQRPTRDPIPSGRQRVIETIEELGGLRVALAQRTSATLHHWLSGVDPGARLQPDRLKLRIQHAGLTEVLRRVRLGELSTPHPLQLAKVLRDIGCHPASLRAWLGLTEDDAAAGASDVLDVEGTGAPDGAAGTRDFAPTLDLLLPSTRATALQQATAALGATWGHDDSTSARAERNACREQLRTLNAEAYQHAAMVSRRFGYAKDYPAWKYMAGARQHDPRVKLLISLSRSREATGHAPDLQLP